MSDIAPFVAASLRDKVVADLMDENNNLREKNRALNLVKITGPEGYPVYAHGQVSDRILY